MLWSSAGDFASYSCPVRRLLFQNFMYSAFISIVNVVIFAAYSSQCAVYFEKCRQRCISHFSNDDEILSIANMDSLGTFSTPTGGGTAWVFTICTIFRRVQYPFAAKVASTFSDRSEKGQDKNTTLITWEAHEIKPYAAPALILLSYKSPVCLCSF